MQKKGVFMMKTKTIYLEYLEEFKSFGIPKKEIEELNLKVSVYLKKK